MKAHEILHLLDDAIGKAEAQSVTTIQLAALKQYAAQLRQWHEQDEKQQPDVGHEARMEQFRAQLSRWAEQPKLEHESNLEAFRAVIQSGQNALRTCLLINGGAAVALLAFLGHLVSNDISGAPMRAVATAMAAYVTGVLAGGLASGFTYLSQWFHADDWDKTGFALNILSILLGLGSLGLFGWGSWLAYHVFAAS
jgi:hypothetical protein